MESSWRQNVANYGFVGSGLRYLARLLDNPSYLVGIGLEPDVNRCVLFYEYDPDQLPLLLGYLAPHPGPFPQGQLVEPDRIV